MACYWDMLLNSFTFYMHILKRHYIHHSTNCFYANQHFYCKGWSEHSVAMPTVRGLHSARLEASDPGNNITKGWLQCWSECSSVKPEVANLFTGDGPQKVITLCHLGNCENMYTKTLPGATHLCQYFCQKIHVCENCLLTKCLHEVVFYPFPISRDVLLVVGHWYGCRRNKQNWRFYRTMLYIFNSDIYNIQ